MDDLDLSVRNTTYGLFPKLSRAPAAAEVAAELSLTGGEVEEAWRRLHEGHHLVLQDDGRTLLMANPFSAVPTPYRVEVGERTYYGNCAWDAFGIGAALRMDSQIHTACPDCGEVIDLTVIDGLPDVDTLLFHCLVPAARWWDAIVFT